MSNRPPPPWPLPVCIGFRFVFSYLMLFLFDPTAETMPHSIPAHLGFGCSLLNFHAVPWAAAVPWTSELMFGISVNWDPTSGSSDSA